MKRIGNLDNLSFTDWENITVDGKNISQKGGKTFFYVRDGALYYDNPCCLKILLSRIFFPKTIIQEKTKLWEYLKANQRVSLECSACPRSEFRLQLANALKNRPHIPIPSPKPVEKAGDAAPSTPIATQQEKQAAEPTTPGAPPTSPTQQKQPDGPAEGEETLAKPNNVAPKSLDPRPEPTNEDMLGALLKSAAKEDDAFLIDFSTVTPTNIFKIFRNAASHCSSGTRLGDAWISDRITYDESPRFKYNFPFKFSLNYVCIEKNEYGFASSSGYMFTMNHDGSVESYGKIFDTFDKYLDDRMKIYARDSNGVFTWSTFECFNFLSVATKDGCKKLRKKATSSTQG